MEWEEGTDWLIVLNVEVFSMIATRNFDSQPPLCGVFEF
jgi:hypothetical protein